MLIETYFVVHAQVMKAVSGKFHPIFQWFYFDAVEALPEGLPLPAAEVAPKVPATLLTKRLCVNLGIACNQMRTNIGACVERPIVGMLSL